MLGAFIFCGLFLGVIVLILNTEAKPTLDETPRERRTRKANHSEVYKG